MTAAHPVTTSPEPDAAPDGQQLPAGAPARPGRSVGRRLAALGVAGAALLSGGLGAAAAGVVVAHSGSSAAPAAADVVIKDPRSATAVSAAAAKAAPSVVTIYASATGGSGSASPAAQSGGSAAGSGSGVILSADGEVLTNNHVVTLDGSTSAATLQVRTSDGQLHGASVVGTDPTSDLAVIRVDGVSGLVPATFADSSTVEAGDLAVAIGAPLGLSDTVTSGIVSATDRAVATGSDADRTVIDAIQTDAPINPGNSGGPLVDAAGQVIGINSAIASVTAPGNAGQQSGSIGVGFAIPSDTAQRVAQQLVSTGTAAHAVLGIQTRTAGDPQEPQTGTGAEVMQVTAGGPADAAGLRVGDVVTAVDGEQVTTSTDLTAAVRSATPGRHVTLSVQRAGSTSDVEVVLGSASQ